MPQGDPAARRDVATVTMRAQRSVAGPKKAWAKRIEHKWRPGHCCSGYWRGRFREPPRFMIGSFRRNFSTFHAMLGPACQRIR